MDPQIVLFSRQYRQLLDPDFLAWPPKQLLRDPDVQAWLFKNLFDAERKSGLPPPRYQMRVLKPLLNKIEQSIDEPNEDEISDDLMSLLSSLMAAELPAESIAVQQRAYVTFSCISPLSNDEEIVRQEPTVCLLERRHLISGSRTTGFRTWEAALHLGTYLLSPQSRSVVQGKNVLELGAGTGFVSILCAKHLGARHVTATDGDEGVIEALNENLFLNGLDDESEVNASVLRWGWGLKGTWVEEECETWPYDVILGADITYDKTAVSALVASLRFLFDLRSSVQILISGAVRNAETFETFRHACLRSNFEVVELDFAAKPMREQTALFYATSVPLKILLITRP